MKRLEMKRAFPVLFLLWVAKAQPAPDPFRISMDVNWVVLQASVHDRGGHPQVAKLRQQDFEVFEDGKPQ